MPEGDVGDRCLETNTGRGERLRVVLVVAVQERVVDGAEADAMARPQVGRAVVLVLPLVPQDVRVEEHDAIGRHLAGGALEQVAGGADDVADEAAKGCCRGQQLPDLDRGTAGRAAYD